MPSSHRGRQGQTQPATFNFKHATEHIGSSNTDNDEVQHVTVFCVEIIAACGVKSDEEMAASGLLKPNGPLPAAAASGA
jgi:hypothetical protein